MMRALAWFAIAVAMVATFLAGGCSSREYGPVLTEPGRVARLCFVPSGHGSGVGVSMRGDLTVSSIDVPARFGVVFECEHGSFAVEDRATFEALVEGQDVTIHYRELIEQRDGEKTVVDLDFLFAEPKER
jgi:hypothetical protein